MKIILLGQINVCWVKKFGVNVSGKEIECLQNERFFLWDIIRVLHRYNARVSVCSVPALEGVREHVVNLGSDVRLPCEIVMSEEEVVVWRLAGPGHHDRILSVGKMLVRNDGKGESVPVCIKILRSNKPPLKAVGEAVRNVPL